MSMDDSIDFTVGFLRNVAKELQALTLEQRLAIADGTAKLKLVVETPPPKKVIAVATSVNADELRAKLEECKSRDDARTVLGKLNMSKKELQRVSRELDLPVSRDDDSERLVDRIVESVVGFRWRSMAIQGKVDDVGQTNDEPPKI
jgi:hypothetical protein